MINSSVHNGQATISIIEIRCAIAHFRGARDSRNFCYVTDGKVGAQECEWKVEAGCQALEMCLGSKEVERVCSLKSVLTES